MIGRLWVKDLPGKELDAVRAQIAYGNAIYMAIGDEMGWLVRAISSPANPWEDPVTVSFAEEELPGKTLQPDETARFDILSAANRSRNP
jgi:hypothetical protein